MRPVLFSITSAAPCTAAASAARRGSALLARALDHLDVDHVVRLDPRPGAGAPGRQRQDAAVGQADPDRFGALDVARARPPPPASNARRRAAAAPAGARVCQARLAPVGLLRIGWLRACGSRRRCWSRRRGTRRGRRSARIARARPAAPPRWRAAAPGGWSSAPRRTARSGCGCRRGRGPRGRPRRPGGTRWSRRDRGCSAPQVQLGLRFASIICGSVIAPSSFMRVST